MPRTKTAPALATETESTTTTGETLTATEQIYERARDELSRLQTRAIDLASNIADASRELEEIDTARQAREQRLTDLRAVVAKLAAAHTQAIHYAGLASGTFNEASSIRQASDSQRELETAQRELLAAEQQAEQDERQASAREASLQQGVATWQTELHSANQQLQAAESLAHRTNDELGQEMYAQLTRDYEERARQVEQARAQLVAAQITLYDYHDEALEQLTNWPVLRRQLANRELHIDEATRTLEATIHFAETLASDFGSVAAAALPSLKVNSLVYTGHRDLRQELVNIFAQIVEVIRTQRDPAPMLAIRASALKQLLEEYRMYVQGITPA